MNRFKIPTREQVSENNQQIFDKLKEGLGFVPNLYAYYAKNENALGDYLNFQNRKSTLSKREKEIVNLVVSEYNGCYYCQSAHTVIAGLNGFSSEEILKVRQGIAPFDSKLNALAKFTLDTVANKGKVSTADRDAFLDAGYSEADLIDVAMIIGEKTISNYIHNLVGFEVDFPAAPQLETVAV